MCQRSGKENILSEEKIWVVGSMRKERAGGGVRTVFFRLCSSGRMSDSESPLCQLTFLRRTSRLKSGP